MALCVGWDAIPHFLFFVPMKHFIIGGARSGKSRFAQQQAETSGGMVTYVATAVVNEDAEMQARIARHRDERPAHWRTVECGVELAAVLAQLDAAPHCIVVDCLTLWLAQCLWSPQHELRKGYWRAQRDALLKCLPSLRAQIVLVSNEVGLGIVPDNAVARVFADEQGWLNQQIAAVCDRVTFMTAGLPLRVKGDI
jgi:adenosylcobinamide kinase / adenosylcobinamide-phosphate guanylyltransferase